jgi:Protein kinase domain
MRVTAHLQHPNIVPLYDSGVLEGVPFYVMPFIDGESLRARIDREKQLSLPEALRITREAAGALAYAHANGVVHRDIKPENILLSDGHALIADFGIAHAMKEAVGDRLTASGLAIGTPAYMSPEQAAGGDDVDGRSDIYSLGCVAFEMLAGIPPFVGPTPQAVIARRLAADAPPVQELRATVPSAVSDAIARALERVPADRWATGEEFGRALDESALVYGRRKPTERWFEQKPVRWGIAALCIIAVGAVAASRALPTASRRVALAKQAITGLRFEEARHELNLAVKRDPTNAEANLWLAQVGAVLEPDSAPEWRHAARVANGSDAHLDSLGSLRARALLALADGRIGDACNALHHVTAAAPADFAAVLTLADCVAADDVVVRNASSPSGWLYRNSMQEAVQLYLQLLREYPTEAPARPMVYRRLADHLFTTPTEYRSGRAIDDPSILFGAFAGLQGDTLVFVPYPLSQLQVGGSGAEASVTVAGLVRERAILRAVALQWARDFPGDPAAHTHLAEALESSGEVSTTVPTGLSALAEVDSARRLFGRRVLTADLLHARLLLKDGQFAGARAAAESLLTTWSSSVPTPADSLLGVATVIGRLAQALDLGRTMTPLYTIALANGLRYQVPPPLARAASDFSTYTTLGAPVDSILALRHRVDNLVQSYTTITERDIVRDALLGRASSMAAPTVGSAVVDDIHSRGNYLIDLEQRLGRGDRSGILADIRRLSHLRRGLWAGATSIDATYIESWVRASAGDTAGALRQLDETLDALASGSNEILADPVYAGTLPRLMELRVDLSPIIDTRRAHWASAVCDLWSDADGSLQVRRQQMCRIARRQST